MLRAIDLIHEGKNKELWQMCCGFLSLSIEEFMEIQERLLMQQLELLNHSAIGEKIMRGARPKTLEEFREVAPLTTYKDYCPELFEKRDDIVPVKPEYWVRTSGRTENYQCKWVPFSKEFIKEMSVISFGIALISTSKDWGDTSKVTECPKLLNAVAPIPYTSGALAKMIDLQCPSIFMPPMENLDKINFEERIRLGFEQALSRGLDGFCGMSLVLVKVGERFGQASNKASVMPYLKRPRAALRLARGLVKSKLAGRPMLPRDLWTVRGIISGGVDSWVYKEKIKEQWGRYPLDVYAGSEGGIYATQTWDYEGMTFIPNLNFFEFIPEDEFIRWEMDRSYKPRTLLLDEVKAGEIYEIVLTNYYGGAMARYRPGDMVRITSLRNEKLGIELPQMVFERRADDLINFMVIKLTERQIWQSIEKSGVAYEDWTAYKNPGDGVLHLLIELKNGFNGNVKEISSAIEKHIIASGRSSYDESGVSEDWRDSLDFSIEVTLLPQGAFAGYTAKKQSEGADLAHLKPPHVNPPDEVISLLLAEAEETIIVVKSGVKLEEKAKSDEISAF
jgi:hypothetical protein